MTNTGGLPVGKRFVRFGQKGSSDVFAILPAGRFAAIECKMPGEKARPDQEEWLAGVRAAGGLALVVTSVDDLRRQLEAEGYPE